MLETDGGFAPQVAYTPAGTRLISQAQSGNTIYYLADVLGSTRALTDNSGTVSDTYRYAAFGELVDSTGITPNKYLFTGQQFDALTGQYSLRARYYAPTNGRFLSYDTWPINTQNPVELNRYVYAAGNPVRYVDPSGYNLVDFTASSLGITSNQVVIAIGGSAAAFAALRIWLWFAYDWDNADLEAAIPDTASSLPMDELVRQIDENLSDAGDSVRRIVGIGRDNTSGDVIIHQPGEITDEQIKEVVDVLNGSGFEDLADLVEETRADPACRDATNCVEPKILVDAIRRGMNPENVDVWVWRRGQPERRWVPCENCQNYPGSFGQ